MSVKRDLYDTTAAARAGKGEIAVFDPGAATGLPTARWSPLTAVTTSSGALRTGRALAQAIPRSGVTNAEYWAKHGEKLLGAFMCVAGLSRHAPPRRRQRRAAGVDGAARRLGHRHGRSPPTRRSTTCSAAASTRRQPLEVKLMARHAATTFTGVAKEDHKIRSSIYATAALALDPWLEPAVAHSASDSPRPFYWSDDHYPYRPRYIDLDWLMAGEPGRANTLYLTASQPEFERLSPVLGGLLADLKDTIHAWDIAGRRLDKPLLIVIDEAGQLELGWLPAEVSTIAALGAFFVTCWQNLSQIQHRYEQPRRRRPVRASHQVLLRRHRRPHHHPLPLRRCSATSTSPAWSTSHDVPALLGGDRPPDRRSVSETVQRDEFAPANTLRQMYPGEAVLLHGTLPPVHLDAVRWWHENDLSGLVPLDDDGNPKPPDGLPTCPLTGDRSGRTPPSRRPSHAASRPRPAPRTGQGSFAGERRRSADGQGIPIVRRPDGGRRAGRPAGEATRHDRARIRSPAGATSAATASAPAKAPSTNKDAAPSSAAPPTVWVGTDPRDLELPSPTKRIVNQELSRTRHVRPALGRPGRFVRKVTW